MSYNVLATSRTPAIIIFLLDVSASMTQPLGNKRRIDVISDALKVSLRQMVFRSTKGKKVSPRYRIGMFAYSDEVYDLLDGLKTITEVVNFGVPQLSTMRTTDTAKAFRAAEMVLKKELPNMQGFPAPLICHMTDGVFTGDDPTPIVKRIMDMKVADGNVLVENIFLSDEVLVKKVEEPSNWAGISNLSELKDDYAKKLYSISSTLPESYRLMMQENNYQMQQGAKMMLPGATPELVAMGFQMAAATPIR